MITYQEAHEYAKTILPGALKVKNTKDYFIFFTGGKLRMDQNVAIRKTDGNAFSYAQIVMQQAAKG